MSDDLLTKSYFYHLPEHLIAQRPVEPRDQSKLLVYKKKSNQIMHTNFECITDYISRDSLIVFNQSKVFSSRLIGQKKSGGKAEIFVLTPNPDEFNKFQALIKARGTKKVGDEFILPNDKVAKIEEVLNDGTFFITFNAFVDETYLNQFGKIPIPPYIRGGESDELDKLHYQTIYADQVGSVAAPTAGLHFTEKVFNKCRDKNINQAYVTLHVGLGTFKTVATHDLKSHKMHSEKYFIDQENLKLINEAPNVYAVGTTSLRVLESRLKVSDFKANHLYETDIFIHPGVDVKSIKGLITNFHLPESTLLMLVSSLIGRTNALELYQIAIEKEYRFFSYGDSMLILLDE